MLVKAAHCNPSILPVKPLSITRNKYTTPSKDLFFHREQNIRSVEGTNGEISCREIPQGLVIWMMPCANVTTQSPAHKALLASCPTTSLYTQLSDWTTTPHHTSPGSGGFSFFPKMPTLFWQSWNWGAQNLSERVVSVTVRVLKT